MAAVFSPQQVAVIRRLTTARSSGTNRFFNIPPNDVDSSDANMLEGVSSVFNFEISSSNSPAALE